MLPPRAHLQIAWLWWPAGFCSRPTELHILGTLRAAGGGSSCQSARVQVLAETPSGPGQILAQPLGAPQNRTGCQSQGPERQPGARPAQPGGSPLRGLSFEPEVGCYPTRRVKWRNRSIFETGERGKTLDTSWGNEVGHLPDIGKTTVHKTLNVRDET